MLPTMSVSHDVVRIADGKIIGVVDSVWTVDGSGRMNCSGLPEGCVLVHTLTYGNVPSSVMKMCYGVGELRNYDSYIATKRASRRYKLSPRG